MAVPVTVRDKVEFHKDVYSTLIKGLLHQKESGELCDVTLRINGCKYFAHKAVLSACSPYFRSMFTSQMRETSCSEVDLTQSVQTDSSSAFQQILDFMYSGDIEITVDNAEDILRISDFLLVDDIKEYCRQFYLQHGNLNLSNCVCLSFLAENHCLPEVARVARNMLKSRFHDHLVFSDALVDVPEGCLFSLLHDRDVTKFASSDSVAQLVLRWVNFSRRERQGALLPLLSSVQLEHLSRDSIKLLLQEDEILKDSALVVRLKSLQSPTGDGACSKLPVDQGTICLGNYAELDNDILFSHQTTKPVLVAANCHPGFHYVKLLVYNTEDRLWHNLPINAEAFLSDLPARLGVVSMTMEAQTLFCLLGHNLPYPSNMLRVHVLAVDIESGQHELLTFRHQSNQAECCQTSLTDDRSVPPVLLYCRGCLVVIGNKEGTGNLFLCDLTNQTYSCYQVPGVRFISLARAVKKDDRYLFVWCRHRYGHEEYCINKEVTFFRFDCQNKVFNVFHMSSPPGISYGEFSDPHVMCVEGGDIFIHTPGKSSLLFDETRNEWVTHQRRLCAYPDHRTPTDLPYHGYEVYTCVGLTMFVLQNPAAYTSSTTCIAYARSKGEQHPPPPLDGVSLLTAGELPVAFLRSLSVAHHFDDIFTRLVHNRVHSALSDTEESGSARSPGSSAEYEYDGYEYDDDIYGYMGGYES